MELWLFQPIKEDSDGFKDKMNSMKRHVAILVTILLLAGCSTVPRSFTPEQPIPAKDFSHRSFDGILHDHVNNGVVQYPQIAVDSRFDLYIDQLNQVDPNALPTHNDRLAFWINTYNAFAIKGILDGYSPRTLFGRYRYFIGRDYRVGGKPINLYDLEQKLLIPDFREPRIHFAIVCASQSCPKLQPWAYSAETIDQQLNDSARGFINDPSRNRFDRENKIAYLSKIFDWFSEDFAAHSGSLMNYVQQFVDDPALAKDLETSTYKVEFLEYDWNLNGVPLSTIQEVHSGEHPHRVLGPYAGKILKIHPLRL